MGPKSHLHGKSPTSSFLIEADPLYKMAKDDANLIVQRIKSSQNSLAMAQTGKCEYLLNLYSHGP